MPEDPRAGSVTVVGLADDRFDLLSPEARRAISEAEVVVGGGRHLERLRRWSAGRGGTAPEELEVTTDVSALSAEVRLRAVERHQRVCVLASGDPGFFGIGRTLLAALDRRFLVVLPASSSVSIAFARLGLPWDDAVVVSAHGRDLAEAAGVMRIGPKVAVLTSPDSPPEVIGRVLLDAGASMDLVAVCSRLGTDQETVRELSLQELADGRFDPLSVVVLIGPGGLPLVGWGPGGGEPESRRAAPRPTLAWGLPDASYSHRAGMITKSEVRAVVLSKLALPPAGVLWDVGAGGGSVAIDCALTRPGLTVLAIESDPAEAARITANSTADGAGVHVVTGPVPAVLEGLPAPDRAFVAGGGVETLREVVGRLRPDGRLVATFAALDRAAEAAELLGNLVQVQVGKGERLPQGGWRLAGRNPLFVVWGPGPEDMEPYQPEDPT